MSEENTKTTPDPIVPPKNGTNKPLKEEETVTVSKDFLENILKQMQDTQVEMRELKKAQGELEKTASPDQIRKIEALRASGKLIKNVKLSMIDGKLVKEWQSTTDEVYIDNVLGKEVSKQMTKITFFDGKTQEMSQIDFARRKTLPEFEVIREGKDKDGEIILTVEDKDGLEININSKFIN